MANDTPATDSSPAILPPIVLTPGEQKLLEEAIRNSKGRKKSTEKLSNRNSEPPNECKSDKTSSLIPVEPPHNLEGSSSPSPVLSAPENKTTSGDSNASSNSPFSDSLKRKYFTLADAFPNAAAFLMFFDYSLRTNNKSLYAWQIEELLRLSDRKEWRIDNKFLYYLLANNGSGKDAFIIAGFVVYVLCCWRRYKIIITSSSDNQLDTQTRVYIKDLAESVNAYMRSVWQWDCDAIDIKAESFKATRGFSGTEVYTFVSKEGGKVEGYHPFPDADKGEGCIVIINEAKSIPEEIWKHLKKCTYNYWIEVSSAGSTEGSFYKACTNAIHYPLQPKAFRPFCRTITYRDTPHKIREAEEEIRESGEDDPFVKNTYLSKFSSLGEQVAVTEESLDACIKNCKEKITIGAGIHAGLDFAAGGGDECSFYVFDENLLIAAVSWRVKDTEVTIDLLIGDGITQGYFQKYGFTKETAFLITGDDNGLGEPIINSLHRREWPISRIKNQSSALRKDRYLNRGAELYATFSRIVAGNFINFNGKLSAKAKRQLQNRHYKHEGQGKTKLIPKEEEMESPDHADAIVLAWSRWTVLDFLDSKVKKEPAGPRTPSPILGHRGLIKKQWTREEARRWEMEQIQNEIHNKTASTSVKFRHNTLIKILRTLYN